MITIQVVQGQGLISGKMGGALSWPQITRLSLWSVFQRLKHFHFVFYPHINASWPSLLIGDLIFLFVDKLDFAVDIFQDWWLGSMAYYVFSVFCQIFYLLIFRISTDGDSFWRLDEQLKRCLVALCQCICYSHFILNANKLHSFLLPYFPLWEFWNRNIHSSWLLWGMSHRKDVTSSSVDIHQT